MRTKSCPHGNVNGGLGLIGLDVLVLYLPGNWLKRDAFGQPLPGLWLTLAIFWAETVALSVTHTIAGNRHVKPTREPQHLMTRGQKNDVWFFTLFCPIQWCVRGERRAVLKEQEEDQG